MSTALIQDYLRTQGLKLPAEAVQIAMLTAGSVMAAGRAEIEPEILWYRGADGTLEQHLPRKEAQTGWLNQIDDVAQWLQNGDLAGSRHRPGSQLAVPVCAENGRVLGVVYLEHGHTAAFNEAAQSIWVGLALALADPLAALLQPEEAAE